jgi:hypothetical protein
LTTHRQIVGAVYEGELMSRRIRSLMVVFGLVLGVMVASTSIAAADEVQSTAFLCPVVGDGVINADAHNGDNGVASIQPPVGTSFLPGNNQAGAHANPNAYNTEGPGNPDAGPGGNPDFSPIWPG